MSDIQFHKVPQPKVVDMLYIANNKNEGVGWDNLGQRKPKFIALHRMWGTLKGTDAFFAPANSPHLTDYAIGVEEIDGKTLAGEIHQYNNPLGYRSGWASGRVSKPYGDGLAIVNKYGINAVNRDGISIELSGYENTPVDAKAWKNYVALIAYWVDYMEIPYTSLPLNPHTGINTFIWHQEFTIGTGKTCPFTWLMNNTDRLYKDVAAYLKKYQEKETGGEVPIPEIPETPDPVYAKPLPIKELAEIGDFDTNSMMALKTREADTFIFVGDLVEAIVDTPALQHAGVGAPTVRAKITKGEQFRVDWIVNTPNGWFYITTYWTRVKVADTKRVSDAKEVST